MNGIILTALGFNCVVDFIYALTLEICVSPGNRITRYVLVLSEESYSVAVTKRFKECFECFLVKVRNKHLFFNLSHYDLEINSNDFAGGCENYVIWSCAEDHDFFVIEALYECLRSCTFGIV